MRTSTRRQWKATLAAIALAAGPLGGQTSVDPKRESSSDEDQTVEMTEYIVTGSNIPMAADATDVPVTVLGTQDLVHSGIISNLQDLLRKEMPSLALGRANFGTATGAINGQAQATAGGSVTSLRDLATLVLVNGRRVSTSGANALGGQNFVDISQFPAAAIDHIEVLTDGASAIYGADAVGGVINVILKSDYQGAEIGGRYGVGTDAGRYTERSGYVVAGAGAKGMNLTVTGSWSKVDPIWQNQRPFIAYNPQPGTIHPGFLSGNFLSPSLNSPSQTNPTGTAATAANIAALVANGTYLAAGSTAIPPFNQSPYTTITEGKTQKGATAAFHADIVPKSLAVFGDIEILRSAGFVQPTNSLGNFATSGATISGQFPFSPIPVGSPYNPTTSAVSGVLAGGTALPAYVSFAAKTERGAFGLRGEINQLWSWEVGGVYSESHDDMSIHNLIFAPNLNAAVAGGYNSSGTPVAGGNYSRVVTIPSYTSGAPQFVFQPAFDPFARGGWNPASLVNLYGTELLRSKSTLTSYDAKVVGAPFSLPGGKVELAVGANNRKETTGAITDPNGANLSSSPANHNWGSDAVFIDSWQKTRTINSFFGELRAPLTGGNWSVPGLHEVIVSVADRLEHYSDTGNARSPKIGIRWEPFDDQFAFRYTYSRAFLAPDLGHQYGPYSVSASGAATLLTLNVLSPSGTQNPALTGLQIFSGNGNNPDLKPSYTISRSIGFVLSPKAIRGLTIDISYLDASQTGTIQGLNTIDALQSVNTTGFASPYFKLVTLGAPAGNPGATNAAFAAPYGLYNYLTSGTYTGNLYVLTPFVNVGGVHETLTDFKISYELPTRSIGRVTLQVGGTYLRSYLWAQSLTTPFYEYAGYSSAGSKSGSFPHWAVNSSVDWAFGNWDVFMDDIYLSHLTDVANGQIPAIYLSTVKPTKVGYYTAVSLQVSYTIGTRVGERLWTLLKGMSFTVGVNNLFDRYGPPAPLSWTPASGANTVDVSTYSPIGRLFFVSGKMKF